MSDAITVVTTVYNGEGFLRSWADNLQSVLRPIDRAILVDDGSDCPVALPEDLAKDHRFKLITSARIGRGAALNLAIENSSTDLIAIQDIDDISLPDRLAQQADILAKYPEDLVFARSLTDRNTLFNARLRKINPARLYLGNRLHHSSLAFHRRVWTKAGGYATDLRCCIDLEFYLRASIHAGATLRQLTAPLISRNLDPTGRYFATIEPDIYDATRRKVLDQYRPEIASSLWLLLARFRKRRGGTNA
ncbi:glycosyltransferase family 2 protein [Thalassospira sp. SM2505]|uniref:Glycosyltransferase 2-like domain-containing protein n=1 Tax=Thalassospira profundimaris TaxID=502049 RepID=A0A367WUL3_9PROT|nr:glycosyltransferase [Thalassospira profundimaris]RCK45078.1 hypothetical protein TH30_13820 [Thalassospira profundimaris]